MKFGLAAIVSALLAAGNAHAEQWRLVAHQIDAHPMSKMYVDAGNLRTSGSIVTTRVMSVIEPREDIDWTKSIVDRQIDCTRMQSRMMVTQFYAAGKLIEENADADEWVQVKPGTMLEGVALVVCGKDNYLGPAIADAEGDARAYFRAH